MSSPGRWMPGLRATTDSVPPAIRTIDSSVTYQIAPSDAATAADPRPGRGHPKSARATDAARLRVSTGSPRPICSSCRENTTGSTVQSAATTHARSPDTATTSRMSSLTACPAPGDHTRSRSSPTTRYTPVSALTTTWAPDTATPVSCVPSGAAMVSQTTRSADRSNASPVTAHTVPSPAAATAHTVPSPASRSRRNRTCHWEPSKCTTSRPEAATIPPAGSHAIPSTAERRSIGVHEEPSYRIQRRPEPVHVPAHTSPHGVSASRQTSCSGPSPTTDQA